MANGHRSQIKRERNAVKDTRPSGRNSNLREHFDVSVSRAVANLATLVEYNLPFVKVGGYFVAYKSGDIDEE